MKAKNYFMLSFMLLSLSRVGQVLADNPHELSSPNPGIDCLSCHVDKPRVEDTGELVDSKNHKAELAAFKTDGIGMCAGCHDADDGHKVGLKLDFEVPADLPLGEKNKLTCLTCHYVHGGLSSPRPQASFSFIDRIVDAERLHKSYLLRRNNADGDLCLTCHEVKEGSR